MRRKLSAAAQTRCSLSAEHRKHWLLCTAKATSLALAKHQMMNTFRASSPLVPLSLTSKDKTPQGKLHSRYFQHINICKQTFPQESPNAVFENLQLQFGRDTCILRQHFQTTKPEKSKSRGFQVSLHKLTQMSKVSKERFSCHRKHKELKISWYHSIQFPVQCYVISAAIHQSQQLIWSSPKLGIVFLLSLFFFFWFYVWLRKLETQKTITYHTKSLISSCHASANVSNTSLNIGGPKQSNNHLIKHPSFFSLYETPITDTMSNVNEVLMMGTQKSVQHFIWGIYGTDSVETWTCVQDPVKSERHEHMVLLCRNRMLNHHCKMGFHSQQRRSDLTNLYGLSQASHPEVAEHNVLWCAILSPPPSECHGSQSLQSTGIYPPAQLLCVRLTP